MKKQVQDPYRNWKIITMLLALGVLVLSLAGIFAQESVFTVLGALLLGELMCASSGMMALVRGRKVLGYFCSVLAGALLVILLIWIVRMIW